MSELSDYIEAHTNFLNVFIPALKNIVNELPLPPAVVAGFDAAYALAPIVITTGAAALSAAQGGKAQPAATDLAEAFAASPAPEPTPAPAPAPATLVPPPTPAMPTLVAPPVPTPAPSPVTVQPAQQTVPDPNAAAASFSPQQLAQLAAAIGLQVMGPGGQVIPPGP